MTDHATLLALADRVESLSGGVNQDTLQIWGVLHSDVAVALGWHRVPPRFARSKHGAWISPNDWIGEYSDGRPKLDSLHGTGMHRKPPPWLWSIDAAMTLFPPTATNIDIFSFSEGWACRFMDTAQTMGRRAAKEQIARLKKNNLISGLRGPPLLVLENAISEHYLEFHCLGTFNPACAITAAALRARAAEMEDAS